MYLYNSVTSHLPAKTTNFICLIFIDMCAKYKKIYVHTN